ncbi:hypothetical protein DENIS_4854 [Desulfonema ishimotonii]|uniref:DNA 3'-5' helicase n=1 Tax=Desulfonema ishimotonii TaxID=45657 RepID=A0A401G412_9BACT|nr:hypothetical protein [Desulfonema ishimotonii]GBC63855.1 hypothetical protein DENIS_4854 [Desulfonema ishimotonii]
MAPESGDRFCFWIPASSRSDLSIVISPLSSLMRDQGVPFKVNGPETPGRGHINCTDIVLGKIRLLYVDPESLVWQNVTDELREIIGDRPLSALIIDKAHCISEWGDDFRPAYRRIPQLISALKEQSPGLTVLALSAMPDRMVRQNIRDILGFREERPPSDTSLYRSGVSFQLVATESPEEKAAAWYRILQEDAPGIFQREALAAGVLTDIPPYRDPYDTVLGKQPAAQESGAPPDLLSVTTRHGGESEHTPRVLLCTALGGSLESWLYKVARAADGGDRLHCVRLADLPGAACEADMAARKTRIPCCENMKCPFGRDSLCDYGKQHHFIAMRHPDVADGTLAALEVLDQLLLSHEAGDVPVQIPLMAADPKRVELALYRLAVIGVVEQFFMDEVSGRPAFKIYGFTGAPDADGAVRGLLAYLKQNDISAGRKYADDASWRLTGETGEIARHREAYGPAIRERTDRSVRDGHILHYEAYRDFFHRVADCMPLLLSHISDTVREMRYRKLWNLRAFFSARTCRYGRLLRTAEATDEEWRCQACDHCVPGLRFEQMRKSPPPEMYAIRTLEARFSEWLENDDIAFDAATADSFIQEFGDYYYNIEVRVACLPERSPRNLKALYLLREFSRENVRERHALDLMRVAHQDLPLGQVLRLYETSQMDRRIKCAQFDCLDDEYSVTHSPGGSGGCTVRPGPSPCRKNGSGYWRGGRFSTPWPKPTSPR